VVRADQPANGERRPRRRGRRGGRRRRGGPEDGLAGSIADELAPRSDPEASSAVADFDGYSEPSPPVAQPQYVAPPEQQPAERAQPEPARPPAEVETVQEAERAAARRRSTVREKVSFLVDAQPAATAPAVSHRQPEPLASSAAPAQPASETTTDTQPRKAGWWSRRFGNGE
jgi:ribonuclease E